MSCRAVAIGLLFGVVLAVGASAEAPARGTLVSIEGRLLDAASEPIDGAIVMLSAGRERFSIRALGTAEDPPLLQPTTTATDGRFLHRWSWDAHYNRFELVVGVEVRRQGRPAFEEVARRDITASMLTGGPVRVGDWALEAGGFLRFLVRWSAGEASQEQSDVFRELGRPERVTAEPDGIEAWWYFARGKVYRFHEGGLDQVIHFDPVPPVGG